MLKEVKDNEGPEINENTIKSFIASRRKSEENVIFLKYIRDGWLV